MKKNLLENHGRMMDLESRLNKNSYLSKDHTPGAADGRIFILLEKTNHIPDRKIYPNLYHWYIIVKQFAPATRHKWAEQQDIDDLIRDIIHECDDDETEDQPVNKENMSPMSEPSHSHQSNFKSAEGFIKQITGDAPTFILNITFKESISDRIREIVSRISNEKIEIVDYYILDEPQATELSVTIMAKEIECQTLKDLISKWPEVKEFHTRQKKFMGKAKTMSTKE